MTTLPTLGLQAVNGVGGHKLARKKGNKRPNKQKKAKKRSQQHLVFPGGHPSKY